MDYRIDKGSIVALIPARGGSKGVPRKNIKNLGGFPLIAYTIVACKLSGQIQRIVVSTDDEEIAEISKLYGAEVPFLRPVELALDSSTDYDFVMHAINWFDKHEGKVPEYLVHMRPTTPLREPDLVDEAIQKISNDHSYTSLRSAHPAPESPFKWFLFGNSSEFVPVRKGITNDQANGGREGFEDVFIPDGYVDVLISEQVLKNGGLHGDRMMAYISPVCTEVDTQKEFEYLEYEIGKTDSVLYKYLKENYRQEDKK
ncbi:MAG: acylneuraminate cytidylyltransferase family protein [Lachnospiraceae bacterium]|nr:acylneuraminate cytidylyltransferase family protein [Lachnospiraceae bacterium]